MAEDNNTQSGGGGAVHTNTFSKGMSKDANESFAADGTYIHARNAVNNSHDGQIGLIGNEPSNIFCVTLPYTMIGCVHLYDDKWIVFTTDDINSEIGIFDESDCTYEAVKSPDGNPINFNCLGLKKTYLITGVSRSRYDCSTSVYFDDGLNPTRVLNINKVPVLQNCKIINDCEICTEVLENRKAILNCEEIRLASLITHPCINIEKGRISGTLPNGSYQACIAYLIDGVRVTDYMGLTEVQGLFTHENTSSSLEITVQKIDEDFDEFELVVIANINAQGVARRIGVYSSNQGRIYVDRWSEEFINVELSAIVLRTEPIEKSDALYSVNNYLLRTGVYSKFKFNYQPLANQITAKWLAVKYPFDYYGKAGNNAGYLRDEQYSFFIRWIYNTGERSESYHIPGRAPSSKDTQKITNEDAFENSGNLIMKRWQIYNTASLDSIRDYSLPDGGRVIAKGNMGYWESTELYPSNRIDIWGALCGKPIRHHKMPDVTVNPLLNHFADEGNSIVILGVEFQNIVHPLDQNGNPIESIVGYEILRGSREGNKSIIGKGMFNNMREYNIPGNVSTKGLYQNYPYNDLRPDAYLTSDEQTGDNGKVKIKSPQLSSYRKNIFSFHSPETTFSNPYLSFSEVKLYQEISGVATGRFEVPYKHPRFKLVTNFAETSIDVFNGLIIAAQVVAAVVGGYELVLDARKDLAAARVGTGIVMAEGSIGFISDFIYPTAVAANSTINAAYTVLFGSRVNKQQLLAVLFSLVPTRQYALQYNSHGFYTETSPVVEGQMRRENLEANYVSSNLQQFTQEYQINNLNRSKFVCVKIDGDFPDPTTADNSRFIASYAGNKINQDLTSTVSSYYGALKIPIPSQYGQLQSIKQLIISRCIEDTKPIKAQKFNSGVTFGGDTYIGRFTEKNSFLFFTDWLSGQPDRYEYNYAQYFSLPYPRFWINYKEIFGGFGDRPSEYRSLDSVSTNWFYLKRGYFYLFNSGVRDFFVESEINIDYRDWEDDIAKRHYDYARFVDLSLMFRSDYIKAANYFKYDYSLSISKLFNSSITWGDLLPRTYDPIIAETCYTYRPDRVIYSLPQQDESKKDSWRIFLANNYADFSSKVSSIKPINKTGALFMLKNESPIQFTGTEELKLDAGTNTKVTIGDGGLFNQPLQNVVNVDTSYEYGSNQGRYCAINTTYGLFWVSQNQGKVFQFQGGLNDITNGGMKWWFAKYLPSQILTMYPDYPYYDNPVIGIGTQLIYDNTNEVIYLIKRDYKPKATGSDKLVLVNGEFQDPVTGVVIPFTNTTYFEDASFTISYDPKLKVWVSFHDWIPSFVIPGRSHFMSVNLDSVWKHNITCTSYCNFYDIDYPFEVEFVSTTGQEVASMRSLEYMLEVYNYYNDCKDKFHVLDENFDHAIVYNSEQISGFLNLILKEKGNPLALLQYPKNNGTSIDINFSKEENKYRFNQFWDVTKDRGEFSGSRTPMFITEANGYKFDINPNYVNYSKPPLERKKFRHYVNTVFLRKNESGNNKFLFKMINEKLLKSYR